MIYAPGTIFECTVKVRGLKLGQLCKYTGGNDMVYQVMPLVGGGLFDLKPAAAMPIDVPNYSVNLFDEEDY